MIPNGGSNSITGTPYLDQNFSTTDQVNLGNETNIRKSAVVGMVPVITHHKVPAITCNSGYDSLLIDLAYPVISAVGDIKVSLSIQRYSKGPIY